MINRLSYSLLCLSCFPEFIIGHLSFLKKFLALTRSCELLSINRPDTSEAPMKLPKILFVVILVPALAGLAVEPARVPRTAEEVARPGGKLSGDVKVALVKIADGFNDPTNVANAGDGTGRIFVVERAGRVKIVHKDGSVQKEPFLDLTNINPLGSDVQTGFVEQGLYAIAFHPRFRDNGFFYAHYASLPFNGDGVIVRFQVDAKSPNIMTAERTRQTA